MKTTGKLDLDPKDILPVMQLGIHHQDGDDWVAVMHVDPRFESLPLEVIASTLETAMQLLGTMLDSYEPRLWAELQGDLTPEARSMN